MVVASPPPLARTGEKKLLLPKLPTVDLSGPRADVAQQIVKAAETVGFFKVTHHGVGPATVSRMAQESLGFFARPDHEKKRAGPADPFGYGCRNIGFNGDVGEVEYVLLNTHPGSIAQRSGDSSAAGGYIEAVKEVACEILDMMAEGLGATDAEAFSKLIRDVDSDSVLRLNHYPPDPQILTVLTSNDVAGLQVHVDGDVWVSVAPDPTAFFVNVGDVLQAMTNGRFVSVKHRALNVNAAKPRLSMAYFAAPPLNCTISPLPEMVTPSRPSLYRAFTWAEYKKASYSLRLGDSRLDLFKTQQQ
ncbi:unnamed protein product [Linum tenue]|uniref:Fe2OG dioxygenase domain-containing protein n=1 Tax=Linum tenue TaxID=586396 RepID=A0AAV0P9P3_9ROSI|nr:unnamed protein product [Linum tenue]